MSTRNAFLGNLNLSLYPGHEDFFPENNVKSWLAFSNGRSHFTFNVSSLILTLGLIFILFNLKQLPGVWHLRILNAFRFTIQTLRPPVPPSKSHIFQPMVTDSTAPLMEIDFNLHKTNSSYFADLDISRTHLVCTLFAKGIEEMRGGTGAITGSKQPRFGLALGGVLCNFCKEIRPYQKYQMWSRILTWDEKWVYIVTHFVRDDGAPTAPSTLYPETGVGPYQKEDGSDSESDSGDSNFGNDATETLNSQNNILATALSRCVFKSGRKTVSPETMLRLSGLLPSKVGSDEDDDEDEISAIETQRQNGLKVASSLAMENQRALEKEFGCINGQILGRHSDGTGVKGVVLTLMQLAGLRRKSCL
ncbi:putative thioesterase atnL [Paramyrothecium foliicola]|nr:putative thioesterase atnL [Paramyrothecium foliicola]